MIKIVTWLWHGSLRRYQPSHVNVLVNMFERHLTIPHEVICITDLKHGFSDKVRLMTVPDAARELATLRTPERRGFPSCYQRLWMFSKDATQLGKRVMLVDVDILLTGNIDHLFHHVEHFVGWQPIAAFGKNDNRVGGGMYLMTTGKHTEIYDRFIGYPSIIEANKAGFRGSDQAWISFKLAGKVKLWPDDSGIYSIRDLKDKKLPDDACFIQFNGQYKPWHGRPSWVKKHWR